MAVAFDASTAGLLSSTSGVGSQTIPNFMTVGASASILIVGIECDTSTPGTPTAHWDSAGTNQAMTQIGTTLTVTGGGAPASLVFFGLVNPTSGSKSLNYSFPGQATSVNTYIYGVSFTGSVTSSVAAATEGFASNNATSTTASVTSAVSIPSGDMATALAIDCGSGFVNATTENLGGTQIGENEGLTNNGVAARFSGSGSTITASASLNASDVWGAIIVGIKASGGAAAAPFFQTDWPLPGSYQTVDKTWIHRDARTLALANPKPQNRQTDWPTPPRPYWNVGFERRAITLPKPTPFRPFDWPNPYPSYWYRSLEIKGNSLTGVTQSPFVQKDWPNPSSVTWYKSWEESGNTQLPFPTPFFQNVNSPLPTIPQQIDQTWVQNLNLFYQSETFPFVQSSWPNPNPVLWYQSWVWSPAQQVPGTPFFQLDWPNPQGTIWYKSLEISGNSLTAIVTNPFFQSDWPLPRANAPIDQFWWNNLQLLPQPTPFFQNVDFPLPVVSQPIDPTWYQNLAQLLQPPFNQTDWPNPKTLYWYRDHNNSLVLNLPVTFPFVQSDWPILRTYQPIDQTWTQSLALVMPVGAQPFIQTDWPLPRTTQPIDPTWVQSIINLFPPPPPPVQQDLGGKTEKTDWTKKLQQYVNPQAQIRQHFTNLSKLGHKARWGY
jgi:hypothetical protein